MSILNLVEKIIADGIITTAEFKEFTDKIHADQVIDADEKEQISRLVKMVEQGKLKME